MLSEPHQKIIHKGPKHHLVDADRAVLARINSWMEADYSRLSTMLDLSTTGKQVNIVNHGRDSLPMF